MTKNCVGKSVAKGTRILSAATASTMPLADKTMLYSGTDDGRRERTPEAMPVGRPSTSPNESRPASQTFHPTVPDRSGMVGTNVREGGMVGVTGCVVGAEAGANALVGEFVGGLTLGVATTGAGV